MNNSKEDLFDWIVNIYGKYSSEYNNEYNYKIDSDEYIKDIVNQFCNLFCSNTKIEFANEEIEFLCKRIKTVYATTQQEGNVILGDYEHDREWFKNLLKTEGYEEFFWNRYRDYISKGEKRLPINVVETLENHTLMDLMSYLGDPNAEESFSIKGLVVGDVQSGKTSNYLGLITRAVDAGYKVVFLLTGMVESLRRQTQIRVEEGFIGFDTSTELPVGVGIGKKSVKAFTSRDKDFNKSLNKIYSYRISDNVEPIIFIIKKNKKVLEQICNVLKKQNLNNKETKINFPILMVDDEADNASINTNKEDYDPTAINGLIRDILALFTKSSYVGFTATPYANCFIDCSEEEMANGDLFPKDFIYSLHAPSNYCGARRYFYEENDSIQYIEDDDEEIFPMYHKKDWYGETLFDSFYDSLNCFFIANTIMDIRDVNTYTHRSMLINMSRFTSVQNVIFDIACEYLKKIKREIRYNQNYNLSFAESNESIKSLKCSFYKHYSNIKNLDGAIIQWEEVFRNMYKAIERIEIRVVNSAKDSKKLDYDNHKGRGLRVIAIGGLALSRGLTLERLCVSYFYRSSATYDVLMQMGRWFGYRDGYDDLCKIFITERAANYYKEINDATIELRNDIEIMGKAHKTPLEFGIRVLKSSRDLEITSVQKRRHTKTQFEIKSCYGEIFESAYLDDDLSKNDSNISNTLEFLNRISNSKLEKYANHLYYRDVDKYSVASFVRKLNVNNDVNNRFDVNQLSDFIANIYDSKYFDVLLMSGTSEKTVSINGEKIICGIRQFDVVNNIVRISGPRTRVGGTKDTAIGFSKEQIDKLDNPSSAKEYLIKERNALLIIYFIDPSNSKKSDNGKFDINIESSTVNFENKINTKKNNYLVCYGIGFPRRDDSFCENKPYLVNVNAAYYDIDHSYLEDELENE